jgi:hypothetical protein
MSRLYIERRFLFLDAPVRSTLSLYLSWFKYLFCESLVVLGHWGATERSLCVVKISHTNNYLVVGLDSGRGFFSGVGVSTLYSCIVIVFIFSFSTMLFPK